MSEPKTAEEARVILTRDQLDAMMSEGLHVHTFVNSGAVLIGCDVERSQILEWAEKNGAELSGYAASAMKHGAVVWDDEKTPTFVATKL